MLLDFLAEKGFDIRSVVEKGVRDKSLKHLAKELAIRTSGVGSQVAEPPKMCEAPMAVCVSR